MKFFALAALAIALNLRPHPVAALTTPDQAKAVKAALTESERISLLTDEQFTFDFNDPALTPLSGAGGKLLRATVSNYAALVGSNLALTVGYLNACSVNTPHSHPRANEVLILLNGQLTAGFFQENGSRVVVNNITALQAIIFPAGSIHFQTNLGCEDITFIAAFSNEDPGLLLGAQGFFALPSDVVGAALGGLGVQDVAALADKVPDDIAAALKSCYDTCGLTYPTSQPTSEQYTSTSTSSISSSSTTTTATTTTTSSTKSSSSSTSSTSSKGGDGDDDDDSTINTARFKPRRMN